MALHPDDKDYVYVQREATEVANALRPMCQELTGHPDARIAGLAKPYGIFTYGVVHETVLDSSTLPEFTARIGVSLRRKRPKFWQVTGVSQPGMNMDGVGQFYAILEEVAKRLSGRYRQFVERMPDVGSVEGVTEKPQGLAPVVHVATYKWENRE